MEIGCYRMDLPTTIVAEKIVAKNESEGTNEETKTTISNYKGLNAIQSGVNAWQFGLIAIA